MTGGRSPRAKGNRAERAIVTYLQDRGFAAERFPFSGSAGSSFTGDITVPLLGRDLCIEVKARSHGFSQLYNWLHERGALTLKRDRDEALVVVPLKLASEIAIAAERGKDCK
jgi:Holliday junction resolvase